MNLDFLVFIRFDSYNHQQKILITPMTRHDCTEELLQELKRRYTMHPARGYNSMIRSRDFHHPVAAEEQRVLALTSKRADEAFSQRVVDAVTSVIQVGKELFPKSIEIAQFFLSNVKIGQLSTNCHECIAPANLFI